MASCLYFLTPGLRGWRSSVFIPVLLTMVVGFSAGREHREWVAKSLIYLDVTDDGSGN